MPEFAAGQPADLGAVVGVVVGRPQDLGEDRVEDRQQTASQTAASRLPTPTPGTSRPIAQDDQDLETRPAIGTAKAGQRREGEQQERAGRAR